MQHLIKQFSFHIVLSITTIGITSCFLLPSDGLSGKVFYGVTKNGSSISIKFLPDNRVFFRVDNRVSNENLQKDFNESLSLLYFSCQLKKSIIMIINFKTRQNIIGLCSLLVFSEASSLFDQRILQSQNLLNDILIGSAQASPQNLPSVELKQVTPTQKKILCQVAIARAKTTFEKVKMKVILTSQYKQVSSGRNDYPETRPLGFVFRYIPNGNYQNYDKSNAWQKKIASDIISNCESISSVMFGIHKTDEQVEYGLMKNGKVETFECIDPYQFRERITVRWGQRACL